MISLTVTGATITNPENKQKTEFKSDLSNDFSFVANEKSAENTIFSFVENGVIPDSTNLIAKKKTSDSAVQVNYLSIDIIWHNYIYNECINKNMRLNVLSEQKQKPIHLIRLC